MNAKRITSLMPLSITRFVGQGRQKYLAGVSYLQAPPLRAVAKDIVCPHFSCLYLLKGHGRYLSSTGKRYPVTAGDLLLRFPGTRHSVYRDPGEDWLEFSLHLPLDSFNALARLSPSLFSEDVCRLGMDPIWTNRIATYLLFLNGADAISDAKFVSDIQVFLMDLLEDAHRKAPVHPLDNAISQAIDLLAQNLESNIVMSDIAYQVGVGYELFRKEFRNRTGHTMKEYRQNFRLQEAQRLLREGTQTLKSIALRLGYSDITDFARHFKRATGISPGKFRNMH